MESFFSGPGCERFLVKCCKIPLKEINTTPKNIGGGGLCDICIYLPIYFLGDLGGLSGLLGMRCCC